MAAAARVGDAHICPIHGAGMIIPPTSMDLLSGLLPQARATDRRACPYGPPDFIVTGSLSVLVDGLFAARVGDKTMHGGVVTSGSFPLDIGGPTAGATLGSPATWQSVFGNAALGRGSLTDQQSYNNCGIESTRLLILATGKDVGEDQLMDWATANHHALVDTRGRFYSGGTFPSDWAAIATSQGVTLQLSDQTPENIQQAVAEKRGVITGHDAGKLWGMPTVTGGHAVTVTGVEYDANGSPANYITNDTGLGQGSRKVPASQFSGSLLSGYQMASSEETLK